MGYTALLVFAGLQGVPKELEEAAMIDGAGPSRKFFSIIVPYIRPVLAFVIITSVIGSFQVYGHRRHHHERKGRPHRLDQRPSIFTFTRTVSSPTGWDTRPAISMILFAILLGVSFIQMKFMKANEADA